MRWSLAGGSGSGRWGFTARLHFLFTPCFPSTDTVWAHSLPSPSPCLASPPGQDSKTGKAFLMYSALVRVLSQQQDVGRAGAGGNCGRDLGVWMCSYYIEFAWADHLSFKIPCEMVPSSCRVSVPAAWGAGGGLPCWGFVADLVLGLYKPLLISVQTHSFLGASVSFTYVSQEVALIPYWLKCLSVWRTHRYNFSKIDCTFIF